MGKAKMLGTKTRDPGQRKRFQKGAPSNSRCPKCQAKLKRSLNTISCNRCGYTKFEEEDKLTKAFNSRKYETIF